MSFKEQLKEYFTFTKGESKGITVLIIILFLTVIINLSSQYFSVQPDYDFSKYNKLLSELKSDSITSAENSISKYDTLNLFKFNPNDLTSLNSKKLGISDYQYNMIQKYLRSGGTFKYKSDFSKIYSITDKQFKYLKPYIDLPEKKYQNKYEVSENNSVNSLKRNIKYFDFNPNTLDDDGWLNLGFSEKQIHSIRKYINAGGKFYKKEDLKKLFVVNDKKYSELEPFIVIPKNLVNNNIEKEHQKVDINNLSADEMKKLGKFWQFNATRIVKYRNLLGGYYKKEQLLEVYGVKKQYYDKIAADIIIDKSKVKKININFAEVSELGRHPYISYQDAKIIIEYRNKNGFINNLNILKTKNIIPSDLYNKISPYLKVK